MNQSINRLVKRGHRLEDIANYSLGQFGRFLEASHQLDAAERSEFVTDMSVVVGSLFGSGKGESPATTHMGQLTDAALGVKNGGE